MQDSERFIGHRIVLSSAVYTLERDSTGNYLLAIEPFNVGKATMGEDESRKLLEFLKKMDYDKDNP